MRMIQQELIPNAGKPDHSGTIAVDFDGVLALPIEPFNGAIGKPIQPMIDRVIGWRNEGKPVVVFTARASDPAQITMLQSWLEDHGLPGMEVTNLKKPEYTWFYDDRATHVNDDGALANKKCGESGIADTKTCHVSGTADATPQPHPVKLSGIGITQTRAREIVSDIGAQFFGTNDVDQTLARAAVASGAQLGDRVKVGVDNRGTVMDVWCSGRGYACALTFDKNRKDQVQLDQLVVTEPGNHTGTRLFSRIVTGLQSTSTARIMTMEAKGGDPAWQGAWVWPKLGAIQTQDDPELSAKAEKAGLHGVKRVQELMATKEGRDWWKANNHSVEVVFDMKPGSYSMNVLGEFRKALGI